MEGNITEYAYGTWGNAIEELQAVDESTDWEIFSQKDDFTGMRKAA